MTFQPQRLFRAMLFLMALLSACAPAPPPNRSGFIPATAAPTVNPADPVDLCNRVNTYWGRDWGAVIEALEQLQALNPSESLCDQGMTITDRLYAAYLAYGDLLNARGNDAEAVEAYQQALEYRFNAPEASQRLQDLQPATRPAPPGCDSALVNQVLASIPAYTPSQGSFIGVEGNRFSQDGQPFPIYGINYYPRDYPNHRFLTETDVASLGYELDLMRASGINTLRLHLRHADLFQCPGNGAIPVLEAFARLDGLISAAAQRGYRVILVLNVDADLVDHPLYDSPTHIEAQTAFIALRYASEPAVIAYDLRAGGDMDYRTDNFSQQTVLDWLARTADLVRANAPDQLITAGWQDEGEVTAPLVDFVSFQHFGDVEALRQEIAVLKSNTTRPIVLAAFGYSTFTIDETAQLEATQRTLEAVDANGLAGWVVWTAFDYPLTSLCLEPNCPAPDSAAHHFGLWNTSYFPKRAVDIIEVFTGVDQN
ncbi:MAG: cellulase family glycosylhydrolase [bacterium]|nr:cellulase family glycosylhydrolase [bacterium]